MSRPEGKESSDTRVAALEEQVRQLQSKSQKKKKSEGRCETCNRGPHREEKCPGINMKCFTCNEIRHLAKSATCKKTSEMVKSQRNKVKSNALEENEESETDSDMEDSNRVVEEFMEVDRLAEEVGAVPGAKSSCKLVFTAKDHGRPSKETNLNLLIDSGVHKTIISEKDWNLVKPKSGEKRLKLKKCKTKFRPFGTKVYLSIMGRIKGNMRTASGAKTKMMIYVVKGETDSLLGLRYAERLGIIQIKPEG